MPRGKWLAPVNQVWSGVTPVSAVALAPMVVSPFSVAGASLRILLTPVSARYRLPLESKASPSGWSRPSSSRSGWPQPVAVAMLAQLNSLPAVELPFSELRKSVTQTRPDGWIATATGPMASAFAFRSKPFQAPAEAEQPSDSVPALENWPSGAGRLPGAACAAGPTSPTRRPTARRSGTSSRRTDRRVEDGRTANEKVFIVVDGTDGPLPERADLGAERTY